MSRAVKRFAATFADQIESMLEAEIEKATAEAQPVVADAVAAVGEMKSAVIKQVKDAARDVRDQINQMTNGGGEEEGDAKDPTQAVSDTASGGSGSSQASAPTMSAERTPIGFVARRG